MHIIKEKRRTMKKRQTREMLCNGMKWNCSRRRKRNTRVLLCIKDSERIKN
jgi:hypothetical protein